MRRAGFLDTLRNLSTRAVEHLLWALSHLVPRRSDLWAFGSWYGGRFADNARYLFLHAASDVDGPRCVWLSSSPAVVDRLRREGFEAHLVRSPRGVLTALRAGVYVFDCRTSDISYGLSGGAVKVNLWHGVPLKRIERDIEDPEHPIQRARRGSPWRRAFRYLTAPAAYDRFDWMVAPGPGAAENLSTAFGLRPGRCLVSGYPRNDALFGGAWTRRAASETEVGLRRSLERAAAEGVRRLVYLPTWRDVTVVEGVRRRVPLPLVELDRVLRTHGARLYCKLHVTDVARLDGVEKCSQIELLPTDVDIYQFLALTDALITDYSSVFFDYLLLDKPLLFYPHDWEDYQRFRAFYYDYEAVTPGPKARTADELVAEVRGLLEDYSGSSEAWRGERERVRNLVHSFLDGSSAERCTRQLRSRLGDRVGEATNGP